MTSFARSLLPSGLALALGALTGAAAFAAASSTPFGYAPDPALRTASAAELQTRIRRACATTQARIQNVAATQVNRGCGCYATGVMRSLDAGEIDAYRATGIFNDSARAKALAAIDICRLRRPA